MFLQEEATGLRDLSLLLFEFETSGLTCVEEASALGLKMISGLASGNRFRELGEKGSREH